MQMLIFLRGVGQVATQPWNVPNLIRRQIPGTLWDQASIKFHYWAIKTESYVVFTFKDWLALTSTVWQAGEAKDWLAQMLTVRHTGEASKIPRECPVTPSSIPDNFSDFSVDSVPQCHKGSHIPVTSPSQSPPLGQGELTPALRARVSKASPSHLYLCDLKWLTSSFWTLAPFSE